MNTVFIILGYSIVVILDMVPLFKSCKKKEKFLYVSIIAVSFAISILLCLNIRLPSPIPFYEKLIMSLK